MKHCSWFSLGHRNPLPVTELALALRCPVAVSAGTLSPMPSSPLLDARPVTRDWLSTSDSPRSQRVGLNKQGFITSGHFLK